MQCGESFYSAVSIELFLLCLEEDFFQLGYLSSYGITSNGKGMKTGSSLAKITCKSECLVHKTKNIIFMW